MNANRVTGVISKLSALCPTSGPFLQINTITIWFRTRAVEPGQRRGRIQNWPVKELSTAEYGFLEWRFTGLWRHTSSQLSLCCGVTSHRLWICWTLRLEPGVNALLVIVCLQSTADGIRSIFNHIPNGSVHRCFYGHWIHNLLPMNNVFVFIMVYWPWWWVNHTLHPEEYLMSNWIQILWR